LIEVIKYNKNSSLYLLQTFEVGKKECRPNQREDVMYSFFERPNKAIPIRTPAMVK